MWYWLVGYVVGAVFWFALSERCIRVTHGQRDPYRWFGLVWMLVFPIVWFGSVIGW